MSNIGQAVLTIAGTAVGAAFGNPQLGFLLGSMAGSALFPTQLPGTSGPRLNDLTVQTSTIGAPIPIVAGTYVVAGNVIWSAGLREVETVEEYGGKGGPEGSQTTYSYFVNAAIGLCEGPIAGVRRVWADAKLVYDRRPRQEGESDLDFSNRMAECGKFEQFMVLYLGDEDQLPDPTIEAKEGVGNVPAFRGLAYAVLTDYPLADFGNRIPNFRWEVYTSGTRVIEPADEYATRVQYRWDNDYDQPESCRNDHVYRIHRLLGGPVLGMPDGFWPEEIKGAFPSRAAALDAANAFLALPPYSFGAATSYVGFSTDGLRVATPGTPVPPSPGNALLLHYNRIASVSGGIYDRDLSIPGNIPGLGESIYCHAFTTDGRTSGGRIIGLGGASYEWVQDVVLSVAVELRAPDNPCTPRCLSPLPTDPDLDGFCILPSGRFTASAPWTEVWDGIASIDHTYWSLKDGSGTYPYDLMFEWAVLPSNDPRYTDQAWWEGRYAEAVAQGAMPPGLVFSIDYPVGVGGPIYKREVDQVAVVVGKASIADIVKRLCAAAGLPPEKIDADPLTKLVDGYAVGRVMSAREAISPLRSFGFFDAVESGGVLKFVVRGGAPVATLTEDELAAHPAGSQRPSAAEVSRTQDVELPRRLRLHYPMPEVNYEPGEQAASRLSVSSQEIEDVEIPVAMSDAEAAQLAEKLLYERWTARRSYVLRLSRRRLAIEPTDVVLAPIRGTLERMRVVTDDRAGATGPATLALVHDDDGAYVSYATGASAKPPAPLPIFGDSTLVLLDLPALREADNEAGYYACAARDGGDAWAGATLYRSVDGATYAAVRSFGVSATIGTLSRPLAAASPHVWDDRNTVFVNLQHGAFASASDDAVLAGANAIAVGGPGRWEIVQFAQAELIGSTWRLRRLLRGRRGTEWAIGTGVIGDRVVLLTAGGIERLVIDSTVLGASRPHKLVTSGESLAAQAPVAFTPMGVALMPYAPVHLAGVRDDDGNLTITWVRRNRLGQTLGSGADVPLTEESELYDVVIMDGATEKRVIAATSPSATYTVADQTADFGAPQASVSVRVYQRSAVVGRGYPLVGLV